MANIKVSAPRLAAALLGATFLSTGSAHAQSVLEAPPPTHYSVDARGVDVISGQTVLSTVDAVVGDPGAGNGMAYARAYIGDGWRDSATGTVDGTTTGATVSFGGTSEAFTLSGSTYTPTNATGGSLTLSGSTWTYVARDGTTASFSIGNTQPGQPRGTRITSLTRPNGETLTYNYLTLVVPKYPGGPPTVTVTRLQTVDSNLGYRLQLSYAEDNPPSQGSIPLFLQVDYASVINRATGDSQTAGYAGGAVTRAGITTTYGFSADGLTSIRRPTSSVNDIVITYDGNGRVHTWADNGNTWTYTYSVSGTTLTTTVTNPLGKVETYVSNLTTNRLTSYTTNPNYPSGPALTTSYLYDSYGRVTRATLPEGTYTQYAYDGRSNVTSTTNVPKSGSGLSNIVTSADYPSTCANPVTCNLPTQTTDALGHETDYTYDSTHGGVLTVTQPAPTTGGTRPQTRCAYTSLYAWYPPSGSGTPVQAPSPVYQLTQTSQCVTGSSCTGTANEIRTTLGYGSTGVGNNRRPVQVTTGAGDGSRVATTTSRMYSSTLGSR
jgi:YD repeat-containing protein